MEEEDYGDYDADYDAAELSALLLEGEDEGEGVLPTTGPVPNITEHMVTLQDEGGVREDEGGVLVIPTSGPVPNITEDMVTLQDETSLTNRYPDHETRTYGVPHDMRIMGPGMGLAWAFNIKIKEIMRDIYADTLCTKEVPFFVYINAHSRLNLTLRQMNNKDKLITIIEGSARGTIYSDLDKLKINNFVRRMNRRVEYFAKQDLPLSTKNIERIMPKQIESATQRLINDIRKEAPRSVPSASRKSVKFAKRNSQNETTHRISKKLNLHGFKWGRRFTPNNILNKQYTGDHSHGFKENVLYIDFIAFSLSNKKYMIHHLKMDRPEFETDLLTIITSLKEHDFNNIVIIDCSCAECGGDAILGQDVTLHHKDYLGKVVTINKQRKQGFGKSLGIITRGGSKTRKKNKKKKNMKRTRKNKKRYLRKLRK